MNSQKKAFTIVELIVVFIILAILSTIAFVSYQGYTSNSRDSVRLSDLQSIGKALNVYKTKNYFYPAPTEGVEVTYNGSEVWTQGTFGDDTRSNMGGVSFMNNSPTDPSTGNQYTYSVLNTKQEYQIGAILENEITVYSPVKSTYAGSKVGKAYIKGDYNGAIAKVYSPSLDVTYVLAVPSIINSDIGDTDLLSVIDNNKLVYDGYSNLPSSYTGSKYKLDGSPELNLANSSEILLFSGSIEELMTESVHLEIADSLQEAYSGSVIDTELQIEKILDLNPGINPEKSKYVVQKMLKDTVVPGIEITAEDVLVVQEQYLGRNSSYTSNWEASCNPDDISIVNISSGTDLSTISTANNTLYRFEEGTYNTTGNFIFGGSCIGLIGVGNVIFDFGSSYYAGLGASDRISFSNISVINTNSGMVVTGSSNISFTDSSFANSGDYGLEFNNVTNGLIDNVISNSNSNDGIALFYSNDNIIKNIVSYSNGDDGVLSESSDDVTLVNIKSYSNVDDGVEITDTTNAEANNLTTYSNTDNGIVVKIGASNVSVSNSYSYNNGEYGFIVRDSSGVTINNFKTHGNTLDGMAVKDGSYDILVNNAESYSNGDDGMFIDDDQDLGESLSYNITVKNSSFHTNTGTTSSGFNSWNSSNLVLDNVDVYGNTLNGIYLSEGSSSVKDIKAYSNSTHGVYLTGSSVSNISDVTAYSNGSDGLTVRSNDSEVNVSNITSYSNGIDGLSVRNSSNVNVVGSVTYSNTEDGVYGNDAGSSSFSNLVSYLNGDDGFQIKNTTGSATVNNIKTYSNTEDGVSVSDSNGGISLKDIVTYSNTEDGIRLYNSDGVTITNYHSYFNTIDGVEINGGDGSVLNNGIAYNNGDGDDASVYLRNASNTAINNIVGFNQEYSIYSTANSGTSVFNNYIAYKNDNDQVNIYDTIYLINSKSYAGDDEGIDVNSTGGDLTYYGDLTVFGNATGDTGTKTQGTSGFLGFPNGNLITSGTFDSSMVIQPNIAGWDYNNSGLQTGLTLPDSVTYNFGNGISKQSQPIKWNGSSFELYGTDGIDYDSSKYIGEF